MATEADPEVDPGAALALARQTDLMANGQLRIYLGAAPGVGKTFAMLEEAHRRVNRGTDVVVAAVKPPRRARSS